MGRQCVVWYDWQKRPQTRKDNAEKDTTTGKTVGGYTIFNTKDIKPILTG